MTSQDMHPVYVRKAEGRTLVRVYDCDEGWVSTEVDVKVPDSDHILSFGVKGQGLSLVVLDPYGDEVLLGAFADRIFGRGTSKYGHVLVIDRKTGAVGLGGFQEEKGVGLVLTWYRLDRNHRSDGKGPTVPEKYRGRLDELLTMKRPYSLSLWDRAMMSFLSREDGYQSLRENVVVSLSFKDVFVELWGNTWREVTQWKEDPEYRPQKRPRKGS